MAEITTKRKDDRDWGFLERIRKGKHTQADLDALRQLFVEDRGRIGEVGDLCQWAFDNAVDHDAGKQSAFGACVKARREIMRLDFGYADALPAQG